MENKYLFIHIEIQDGEFVHNHKVVIITKCKSLEYAAIYYVAHYWGYGVRELKNECWWWHGVLCGRIKDWTEVSKEDYKILSKYI